MNRGHDRRAAARAELAISLNRLAAQQRAWAGALERAQADLASSDSGGVLARAVDLAREFRCALDLDVYVDLDPELIRELESGHVPVGTRAEDFASRLEKAGVDLLGRGHAGEARLLACLAGFLPAKERSRFVAEELGNLGGRLWWQRAAWLGGVAIGMPGLAWTMQ